MNAGSAAESPSVAGVRCPYVGLRPFRESDAPFFFGREREVRVIASNMLASSLTVLYGPSGVGKSSVLQAGVIPVLRQSADTHITYFNSWQGRGFLADLIAACEDLPPAALAFAAKEGEPDGARQAEAQGHRYIVVLDQFEEYLRYQADDASRDRFEAALARLVNRDDSPVNVLIGIREDALWMLDRRLSIRVANLLSNTVALEHLASEQGPLVVREPIRRWNEEHGRGRIAARIDDDLVSTLLEQVRSSNVKRGRSAGAATSEEASKNRIEIAYLQLVLEELWMRAAQSDTAPFHLSLAVLGEVGGADRILQTYVSAIIDGRLNAVQRRICAGMIHHLVTPSGAKFAQETGDLVTFAKAPAPAVKRVLALLAGETGTERNLLRKSENPEKYEISHDVLGHCVLDWRLAFASAERVKRNRSLTMAGLAVLLALVGGWWLFVQLPAARARQDRLEREAQVNQLRKEQDDIRTQVDYLQRQVATAPTPEEAERLKQQLEERDRQLQAIESQTNAAEKERSSAARTTLDSALQQIVSLQDEVKKARQERDEAIRASDQLQKSQEELDSLRERAQAGAPMTAAEKITVLEDQLREAQRDRDMAQREAGVWKDRVAVAEKRLASETKASPISPQAAGNVVPVEVPKNSAVRAENVGLTFFVDWSILNADVYVLSGSAAITHPFENDKTKSARLNSQVKDGLKKRCAGSSAQIANATVWCFRIDTNIVDTRHEVGQLTVSNRTYDVFPVAFDSFKDWIALELRPVR